MKKVTKLLSVFLIAGAVGTGVAGISACSNKTPEPEHQHTAATEWQKDANGHWKNCTANDGAKLEEGAHVYDNDQDANCNTCGYTREVTPPVTGFVIPAAADELIIEGVGETEVQLSTEKTSHSIDKTAIKVYLNDGAGKTKGTEVPAANLEIGIKDPTNHDCEWSGLKADGAYTINVKVINATVADGSQMVVDDFMDGVTVTVHNAINATSLAVKAGATLTQAQSVQDKMTSTWTYEVTRANGDKEDVAADKVTVTGVVTNVITASATANLSCTIGNATITGTVNYSITENTALHTKTYAVNFSSYPDTDNDNRTDDAVIDGKTNQKFNGGVATGTKFIEGNGTTLTMMATFKSDGTATAKVQPNSTSHEQDSKYFYKRFTFGGGSFTSKGATQCERYLKLDVDGPAKLTIYYSADANRGVSVYDSTTPFDAITTETVALATDKTTVKDEVRKLEVSLPKAGTYMITTATKDAMYFQYIEVATEFEDENGTDITLAAGENVARKIELTTPETIPALKVGATFSTAVTAIKVVKSNTVNCAMTEEDATDWATAATYKMGTTDITADTVITEAMLGKQTITVTYGGLTATYDVTVEAAVDGITGINASLASTVNTKVDTADSKLTLTKNDVKVALVGENAGASVKSYTVKYNGVEVTTGTEFAVGNDYELTVTAVVEAGTQSATFTDTFKFNVTVKPAAGSLSEVSVTFNADGAVLSLADNTVSSVALDTTNGQIRTQGTDPTTYNTKGTSISSNSLAKRTITLTLKQAGTYTIVVKAKTSSAGRHVIYGSSTTEYTASTTEVSVGSFNDTTFSNVALTGTTLIIAADANIDISEIIITPVNG